MEKEYIFEVTLKVVCNVHADSEEEARGQLTEEVEEYLHGTTREISKDEAELIEVRDA